MVSESVKAYRVKKQGEYTLEDYYALPDERRVELIDGVVYDMSSPTSVHQILAAEIWQQIKSYINKREEPAFPLCLRWMFNLTAIIRL